jgi:hypothetical protein
LEGVGVYRLEVEEEDF